MKKLIVLGFLLFFFTACGKVDEKKLVTEFKNKVLESKTYIVIAEMSIISNEDTYVYDVNVNYKKDNNYKVVLKNRVNNHEQVLLKNKDAVYVITPELNKSFKFQSEWPDNSSQGYLLKSIVNDINNDKDHKIEKNKDNIIVTSKVNYPNNNKLTIQKTYFDNEGKIISNTVIDGDGKEVIKVKFTKIEYNPNINDEVFELESIVDENCCSDEADKETGILDNIIYPLYIPTNTYLNTKDVINNESNNRAILTFSGSKPFMLVEELVKTTSKMDITPVFGEPVLTKDGFGAITSNSLSWISNNVEYYITGETLTGEELLTIAESLNYETQNTMNEK